LSPHIFGWVSSPGLKRIKGALILSEFELPCDLFFQRFDSYFPLAFVRVIIHVLDALFELVKDFGISEQLGTILHRAEVDGLQNANMHTITLEALLSTRAAFYWYIRVASKHFDRLQNAHQARQHTILQHW